MSEFECEGLSLLSRENASEEPTDRVAGAQVEEFMLLANRKVAEFLSEKIPSAALLRRHPPPHRRKIEGLTKMTEKMGVRIDTHASGAIHDSLERIRTQVDESTFFAVVLLTE